MNPAVRNVLAIIAGVLLGSILNMLIVHYGMQLIPLPKGADMSTPAKITASLPLLSPKHFVVPFLAHALGTLAASYFAIRFSATKKQYMAWFIGIWFMLGGVVMTLTVPFPIWTIVVDLLICYIPPAWLGWKLAKGVKR